MVVLARRSSLLPKRILLHVQSSQAIRRQSITSSSTAPSSRPLKLAIIGAGPSGFYTASRILSQLPASSDQGKHVQIHMYDRLPTPYGLARYGVAPDHPEVKNCQHKFDELASDPRFQFFGNVSIGSSPIQPTSASSLLQPYTYPHALHLPLSSLLPYYTTMLFSYGSSLSNALPTTDGSSSSPNPLKNVFPALSFVSWYNGHPAYTHLSPDLTGESATIIGHGNVAIDCARILLKDPSALSKTDIPTPVLEKLKTSNIKHVHVVGRRGPAQVAFTTKEFREMTKLENVEFRKIDRGLMEDAKKMAEGDRAKKRLLDLMNKGVEAADQGFEEGGKSGETKKKTFELGFLKSPKSFLSATGSNKVDSIQWSLNSLLAPPPLPPTPFPTTVAEPSPLATVSSSNMIIARPTGEEVNTKSGLVIESVGYRSEGLRDLEDGNGDGNGEENLWGLPFDERKGRVLNQGGRIVDASGIMIPGLYTAGWVASGPTGVIASTMQHAYSVSSLILSDHFSSPSSSAGSQAAFASPLAVDPKLGTPEELRMGGKRVVSMSDWKRIDQAEQERGRERGKPREKFLDVGDMLRVLD